MNDGLTYATPSYKVKYLMDNCEVYAGLSDASKIYARVFSSDTANIDTVRRNIKTHILNKMWNKKEGIFIQSIDETGDSPVYEKTDVSVFYPDAVSQLYPVIEHLVPAGGNIAEKTYSKFNSIWDSGKKDHSWTSLDTTDENCWGALAYSAAVMNDRSRVQKYVSDYKAEYSQKHQYPLFTADAAKVVRAAILEENTGD